VSLEGIVIHIQAMYKDESHIAKLVKDFKLVVTDLDPYPVGTNGNPPSGGEIFLWPKIKKVELQSWS
jgi:hypothetical protein